MEKRRKTNRTSNGLEIHDHCLNGNLKSRLDTTDQKILEIKDGAEERSRGKIQKYKTNGEQKEKVHCGPKINFRLYQYLTK